MTTGTKPAVSAVILAAGASQRMGASKAALRLGSKTFVEHLVHRLAPVTTQISIVSGAHPIQAPHHAHVDVHVVAAKHWRRGMRASLSAGLRTHREHRVIITHIDRPLIRIETLLRLLKTPVDRSVIPVFRGCLGHPVVLPAHRVNQFIGQDVRPLRWFIPDPQTLFVTVDDPGVILNINDPREYARCRFLFGKSSLSACIHE
ncbi:MAG: NTP transferase domain-containing protein [Myxococcota bacterium]|nr:NTP transferase domain-containing protein [Myxococcota bacterium]